MSNDNDRDLAVTDEDPTAVTEEVAAVSDTVTDAVAETPATEPDVAEVPAVAGRRRSADTGT